MVGAGADLRMLTADVGAFVVDGTAARDWVEKVAVAVGAAGERVDFVLAVEVVDDAGFLERLGDLLGRQIAFKGVDHFEANQVADACLDRHGAAACNAVVAKAFAVFDPGVGIVHDDDG